MTIQATYCLLNSTLRAPPAGAPASARPRTDAWLLLNNPQAGAAVQCISLQRLDDDRAANVRTPRRASRATA